MVETLSARLRAIVDALPLRPGIRVLEIGCGPGTMAREIARRIGSGQVLGIDRSDKAIAQARAAARAFIGDGRVVFQVSAAETFALPPGEPAYDLAVAIRVGALDGRHPDTGIRARAAIRAALVPGGTLFIDGGDPLREIDLG